MKISQTFKNVGRITEIVGVLMRHGFADLIHRIGLSRLIPDKYSETGLYTDLPTATRLRMAFEKLGPTFVKLGQLLATRPDLIQETFIEEFQKLQDEVGSLPFKDIRNVIELELQKPLESIFQDFETEPLAAASIAQVHGAVLKTGEAVAIKVQRPGIERSIQTDLSILNIIAQLLEKYIPEVASLNPTGLVEEFNQSMKFELDFRVEANNIHRIKSNMVDFKKLAIPMVFSTLSTGRVLVLERFKGVRFTDRQAILAQGFNTHELVEIGSDAFFYMVMHDGLFHGDLHPGNLFVLPDGRIGLIDFGIVGRLSRRVRDSIIVIFTALMEEDFETLTYEYLNLSEATRPVDPSALQKDLMDTISPFIGMSLGEVNVGLLLFRSANIAARHSLRVPRELLLLFKALVTIEAMGRKIEPNFDMMQNGTRLARQFLSTRYNKQRILRDLLIVGRDLQALAEIVPRHLRRFLRTWSQNQFVIQTRNEDIRGLSVSVRDFSIAFLNGMLAFGFFATGIALLILDRGPSLFGISIPAMGILFTGVAIIGYTVWNLKRKS